MSNNSAVRNHPIPNAPFFREVEHFLQRRHKVTIYVQGESMRPFLKNGDKVLLSPIAHKKLSEGDIVLAHTVYGILLHRIVRIRNEKISLAGDANSKQLEYITRTEIIGIVEKAWRKEKVLCVNSFPKRALAFLWYLLRPFRGYILGAYNRLKQIK